MKKLVVPLLKIFAAISYINAKRNERERIWNAVEKYTYEVCGSDRRCVRRIEKAYRHCFEYSYVSLPKPSTSYLDLDLYVDCMNESGYMPVFEIVRTDDALPIPAR